MVCGVCVCFVSLGASALKCVCIVLLWVGFGMFWCGWFGVVCCGCSVLVLLWGCFVGRFVVGVCGWVFVWLKRLNMYCVIVFWLFGGVLCPLVWCGVLVLLWECFVGRFVVGCVFGGLSAYMCTYCVSVFWLVWWSGVSSWVVFLA